MFFCPICSNSYNINKSIESTNVQSGGKKFDEEDVIQLILDNHEVDKKILAEINLKEFKKKPYFKKLDHKNKEHVYNVISHYQKKPVKTDKNTNVDEKNMAYFQCNNCGFYEKIKEKTLIFSKILSEERQDIHLEDYSYMLYDNTKPRTKNYTCGNSQCITHKKPTLKEAVFFRLNNTYKIVHLCTVCKEVF